MDTLESLAPAITAETLEARMREGMLMAFPTPIVNMHWADNGPLNEALTTEIIEATERDPGVQRSTVGGWHSAPGFLLQDRPCLTQLRTQIEQCAVSLTGMMLNDRARESLRLRFQVESWANVLRPGGYNSLHAHPNSDWSGVYYVNGNPPPRDPDAHPFSGRLELIDPRPAASLSYAEHSKLHGRFVVNPRAGQMVLFPAWLQHLVHPYFGEIERLSIAFNVRALPVGDDT